METRCANNQIGEALRHQSHSNVWGWRSCAERRRAWSPAERGLGKEAEPRRRRQAFRVGARLALPRTRRAPPVGPARPALEPQTMRRKRRVSRVERQHQLPQHVQAGRISPGRKWAYAIWRSPRGVASLATPILCHLPVFHHAPVDITYDSFPHHLRKFASLHLRASLSTEIVRLVVMRCIMLMQIMLPLFVLRNMNLLVLLPLLLNTGFLAVDSTMARLMMIQRMMLMKMLLRVLVWRKMDMLAFRALLVILLSAFILVQHQKNKHHFHQHQTDAASRFRCTVASSTARNPLFISSDMHTFRSTLRNTTSRNTICINIMRRMNIN